MSMTDPFLPEQGDDELRAGEPAEPRNDDLEGAVAGTEGEDEPDVHPGAPDAAEADVEGQPVARDGFFQTPTGTAVDPADD